MLSLIGIIVLMPLIIIFSLLIWLQDFKSPFYVADRVGKYGKLFKMIKFRTMYFSSSNTSPISLKGDTRITKFGVFLRKYKFDELPELFNVLIGQMSLVGPRPDVEGYADRLHGEDRFVLKLKPGITGPASLKYSKEEEILVFGTIQYAKLRKKESGKSGVLPLNTGPLPSKVYIQYPQGLQCKTLRSTYSKNCNSIFF